MHSSSRHTEVSQTYSETPSANKNLLYPAMRRFMLCETDNCKFYPWAPLRHVFFNDYIRNARECTLHDSKKVILVPLLLIHEKTFSCTAIPHKEMRVLPAAYTRLK